MFSFCKDHGNISGTKSNYTNQTSLKQFWFSVPLKLRNLYHTDLIDLAAQPHSSICCDLCIIKPNTFTSHLSIFDQGTWWYKSIQYSCEQILLNTTQLYIHFFLKTPAMQSKRMYTPRRKLYHVQYITLYHTSFSINHNHYSFLKCDWCISCFIYH